MKQFAVIFCVLLFFSGSAFSEFSGNIYVANTRIFRGIEQIDHRAVPQASIKYSSDQGWYLGILATRVEFQPGNRKDEREYFAGYGWSYSDRLSLDMTYVEYEYAGDSVRNYDWREVQLRLGIGDNWSLTLGQANNWLARGERSNHAEINYLYGIATDLHVKTVLGAVNASNVLNDNYLYAELALIYTLTSSIYMRLGVTDTDNDFGPYISPRAERQVTFGAGYLF